MPLKKAWKWQKKRGEREARLQEVRRGTERHAFQLTADGCVAHIKTPTAPISVTMSHNFQLQWCREDELQLTD